MLQDAVATIANLSARPVHQHPYRTQAPGNRHEEIEPQGDHWFGEILVAERSILLYLIDIPIPIIIIIALFSHCW